MRRIALIGLLMLVQPLLAEEPKNVRPPKDEADMRYWLENMVWYHHFTTDEIRSATGMSTERIESALKKFNISQKTKPRRAADAPLLVLPYPGGRHPRIGFLDGAILPQRETKISVFMPWDDTNYVVLDVPEAIWHNGPRGRELYYLAHDYELPTIWVRKGIRLDKLEWQRNDDGTLLCRRRLPDGVEFGTKIIPGRDAVRMEMWLTNGSKCKLTGLDVQNCIMFKGAPEFAALSNDNNLYQMPYACRSNGGDRWLITAWVPLWRTWANPRCPCLHSDPRFPDCEPGQTKRLRGWLSFYEGKDLKSELRRIEATGWRKGE
ncbi:MAG: hypothetical protein JXM70_16990 [Pirellulales bacterium]|nr:hypothetical protein [Pirellulales bacterium]